MAFGIPGAAIHRIDDGHIVCASEQFAEPFVAACLAAAP